MKVTVYIINAILFMGCCLLVSTTTPDVKDMDVNNKITYVNSDAITKEEIIEIAPVEVVDEVEEEVVVEDKEEEIEEEPKKEVVKEEVKEDNNTTTTPTNSNNSSNTNNSNRPSITVGSIFTGSMSGYGSDIGTHTASGHYIGDSIYYSDHTYGDVRILSGDDSIPFGTIVKVNSKIGEFIGIVIDTGGSVGFDGTHDFDLLFKTSNEALNFGVSKNTTFEILRVGY